MSMSLYESVVNESFGTDFLGEADTRLDPAIEAEINDRVNDDASFMQYTGECLTGMMALEAAMAKFDGMMAVKAIVAKNSNDAAAMEALDATMEGFVSDAWETLKEWVNKAYQAIKAFLIKQWNRLKGAANVVKAFFTKYGDVLRSMNVPDCKVKWLNINIDGGEKVFNKFNGEIKQSVTKVSSAISAVNKNYDDLAADTDEDTKRKSTSDYAITHGADRLKGAPVQASGNETIAVKELLDHLPTPKQVHDELINEIYPDGEEPKETGFTANVRSEAIEAADIGKVSKYIQYFQKMGDTTQKDSLRVIETAQKEARKSASESKKKGSTILHSMLRRCYAAQIQLFNMCTTATEQAAKRKINQSVAACRKAIMHHSTKGKGATQESWNPSTESYGVSDMLSMYL